MDSDNGDSAMDVEVDVDEAGVCSGGPCSSGDTATTRHVLAHIAAAEVAGDNGHHVAMDPLESGDGQLTQRERDRRKSEKEKERTKMRERYRRAVTGRILAGLRKHGNYSLPMRADINDVLRALAREAGWTVDQDGTTYRSNPNTSNAPRSSSSTPISSRGGANAMVSTIQSPQQQSLAQQQQQQQQQQHVSVADTRMAASVPCHLMGHSFPIGMRNVTTPDVNWSTFCPDTKLKAPKSAVKDITKSCKLSRPYGRHASFNNLGLTRQIRGSVIGMDNPLEADVHGQVDHDFQEPERNFADTGYVPIYVMLPLGIVNHDNRVVEPERLIHDLRVLKSLNVDGVMVDVWWGLVEKDTPQRYDWTAYKYLFNIVRSAQLKLQVVMSFHQCGGNVGDDVNIPLPRWILDVGAENSDIYFTDKHGTRNTECLSWGVDKERVLRGRTGLEVFFDFMRSFRQKFDELFVDGTIAEIEVGLGACGELRYPSYPPRNGWTYPGIGEFQCYDRYLMKGLRKAAEARGHPEWGRGPDNTGDYNSRPHDTDFFRDGGDYDSYYGRFFVRWYSDTLIEHGDRVLALSRLAFEDTKISAKISGIHWWYKMASHAAELTAGFYNPSNRDGYAPITQMLAKHNVTFNFTCVEHRHLAHEEEFPEAMADPEGLVWQVLNAAWDASLSVASENALPCFDRDGYNKILENVKPRNNPDKRHMASFTYLRLSSELMERDCLVEFTRFVKCLHGFVPRRVVCDTFCDSFYQCFHPLAYVGDFAA